MAAAAAVDIHAHWLPTALAEALRHREDPPRITEAQGQSWVDCGAGLVYPLLDGLADLDDHRSRMRREGVGRTLLSAPPPGVDGLPEADAVAVARACNDELAGLAAGSGGALGGLALLPLDQPEAAAAEVERASGLGLAGAQLFTNSGGSPLEASALDPLLAAASELSVPLVLHPTAPVDRGAVGDLGLLTTLGFLFDSSAAAARLVLGGAFERHPALKLVLPHAGAAITPLLGRFDYELELMGEAAPLSAAPSEHLRLLYVDSICESPGALQLALDEFGADHVLFGSDEPFWRAERARATVDALDLDTHERDLVLRGNAQRLFSAG